MDEFWVCQNCRSLNRAGSSRCYGCRSQFGSQPKASPPVSVSAPPPPLPAGPAVSFAAPPVQASFYSRPVALASAAASTVAPTGAVRAGGGSRFPHPIGAIGRRVGRSLSMRQSVSVAPLGYVTLALMSLAILFYLFAILAVMPAASYLLQHADPVAAWNQLSSGQKSTLEIALAALAVVAAAALVAFSVFVGLSTHNAAGLGAGQPILSPYRAGTCWAGALRTQALIGLGLIVPTALVWRGYTIPGLIAALVAVELAHRRLDDLGGWLTKPARHLPDLYVKLGVDGSTSSPLATAWSVAFRLANLAAVAVSALPLLALTFFIALLIAKRNEVVWQSTGLGPIQLAVAVFVAALVVLTILTVALLIPMTIGLVRRQQTRRTLVRVGRSRSWVARPGEGMRGAATAAPAARYEPSEDEDRIVERRPTFAAGPLGEPGAGGPDQASLYSPSTTSSFPWSDGSPDSPD